MCHNVVLAFPYDRRQRRHGHGRHRPYAGRRVPRARLSSRPVHAGTAEPFRVSPPEAVAYPLELAPCGRTVLVDLVPDSPPIRTGHDGQRIGDESLGLTSAVLPAWAVSWALTTPRPLCLLAGYLVAGHN